MLFPFPFFFFLVAIEMTFLRKGKNFSSPISQGQSSIPQPSIHLGLTFDLWSAEGEWGILRKRKTSLGSHLCRVPPLCFAAWALFFTAFPSLPHCVEQTLQCWLNLAMGVTVLAQMSTSIAFTSCWGVQLSCSSLLFCAGHQEHKNKISRLFASEGLLTR